MKKHIIIAAAAFMAIAGIQAGSAQAGMANMAAIKDAASTQNVVKAGFKGGRKFGKFRKFHRFKRFHHYGKWHYGKHFAYHGRGCGFYWRKWKRTGYFFWKKKYYNCKYYW